MLIISAKIYTKSQNSVKIVHKTKYMGVLWGQYFSLVADYIKKSGHEKKKREKTLL